MPRAASRDHHPSTHRRTNRRDAADSAAVVLPRDKDNVILRFGAREVALTNLRKLFWPERGYTKGDLLQYYADMAPYLLPHLVGRAMVMKRYPNGIDGKFFFMKHAPTPRPDWIEICSIEHKSGNIVDFPIVQDLPSLLWIVNLGCIDLNQWYAPCGDVDRPDYVHFDLDPQAPAGFAESREAALVVHEALDSLKLTNYAKTTGSRGVHLTIPIVRGPTQKQVWTFAKALAQQLAARHPKLLTAEYRIARRPAGRVLVDYNQNAWGRTLASIYSVRPRPAATVSTPVTWEELARGVDTNDFRIDTVPDRVQKLGDLWKPVLARTGRCRLDKYLGKTPAGKD